MFRLPGLSAVCLLLLLPRGLAAQQPYPHLARVVGAIRAAALMTPSAAPPRGSDPLELDLVLPPLGHRPGIARRRVLHLNLTDRIQLRATGDWAIAGVTATVGVGLRF